MMLGYGINFEYDAANGSPVSADAWYRYVAGDGFQQVSPANAEEVVFPGQELLNIATGEWASVDEKRLRYLSRQSLSELLGEKPLNARSLFRGRAG